MTSVNQARQAAPDDSVRLYYSDAYLARFEASVVERADGGRRVYLNQTAFYPTSGGQPHDVGLLAGIHVLDVIDEGDRVAHVLSEPLPPPSPPGDQVTGVVDWDRRFDHMQQHTGQHLLSAVFADLFGHATVSVHFGRDASTLDLDAESLTRDHAVAAEARANALVFEDRPVTISFEEANMVTGLRKPSDRSGTLRVVTIEGVDRSGCGGTHVRTTGELGVVLVRRLEKVRKAIRVEFVCGHRAARRARADFETLTAAATVLSAASDDLPVLVANQVAAMREMESRRKKLERDLVAYRARELWDASPSDSAGGGIRRVVVHHGAGSADELRALAQAFSALPRAVLVGTIEAATPPSVLLAASPDSGIDAGKVLKEIVEAYGGRGGGSPRLAQASVPSAAVLSQVLERLAPPA